MGSHHSRPTSERSIPSTTKGRGSRPGSIKSLKRFSRRFSRESIVVPSEAMPDTAQSPETAISTNSTPSPSPSPSVLQSATEEDNKVSSRQSRPFVHRPHRHASRSPSPPWQPVTSSRRTRSILSCETNDSNARLSSSAGSSSTASMMWSGGMFSQLDLTSTITTVTAFSSTVSRRSQFCQDWPSVCVEDKLAIAHTQEYGLQELEEEQKEQDLRSTDPQDLLQQLKESRSDSHRILRQAIVSARTSDDQSKVFHTITLWGQETNDPCALVWSARCLLEGWGTVLDTDKGFSQLRNLAELGCWESFYPLAEYFYHASNNVEAAHWFKAAAELDPGFVVQHKEAQYVAGLAQYRLGELIFKGEGIAEDAATALEWFQKSAQNGNKYGQYIAGIYYEQGIVVQRDIDIAEQYLLSAAQQGFADAQAALGILLVDHKNDITQGKRWLEHAAQVNNARALLKLGLMYEHSQGVDADHEQALYYYKTAAITADDAVAQYVVGLHYRLGSLGLQQDYKEAGRFLHRSAKAGFAPAQRIIGLMFAQGLFGKKDEKTALLWFRRAALQGDVHAMCLVGSCYEHGRGGVQASQETAMEHYQKAARITSPFQAAAQLILGQLLFSMDRYRDAFDWFQKAAVSTEEASQVATSKALLMIARYYLHGWAGVKKDSYKAFNILASLAKGEQDGGANYWLAACYEEGLDGVCPRDLKMAFKHYMIAAQTGDVDAEFQVALMLSNGQGIPRDRKGAMPWYEKAARKGHKVALYSLGLYYAKGIAGTPVDLNRARICFEKAAKKGVIAAMTSLAMLCRIAAVGNEPKNALNSRNQHEYSSLMIHWYQKAASLGDAVAQRELAMLYDAGFGVAQDYQTAFQLLQLAADQNDARATLLLGSYYQNGLAVETSIAKALELYHAAAKLGASVAPFAAAQVYHSQNQFQDAFTQYLIAARDTSLTETRIGKTSRFMVARYVLGYITVLHPHAQDDTVSQSVNIDTGSMTKQEAFEMLRNLAEKDAFDQSFYWLGESYRLGNGIEIDLVQAVLWYQRAAEVCKDLEAMIKLATAYEQGLGVDRDDSKALFYYQTSAEQGHPEAQHKMGMAYWRGLLNVDINLGEAVVWFTRSAAKYAASSWALGQMALENGDEDVAIAWWHKSIALGHAPSMRALASLLLQTQSEQSQQKSTKFEHAMELLAEAVRSGDAESLVLLGQLHQAGAVTSKPMIAAAPPPPESDLAATVMMSIDDNDTETPPSDEHDNAEIIMQKQQEEQELATRCFQQAAAMGHVEAMFLAAQSWHAQEQFAAALEFYERAASHGHLLSRVMKARYQIAGLAGLPADPEAGYRELVECAQNDNCVDAYNSLGQCHELGLGTPQDDRRALEWYLKSAEATQDAEAMFRIGQMHAQGRVPSQDPTLHKDMEALQWYKFACESRSHPRAHYYIGLYYLYGIRDERTNPSTMALLPDPTAAMHHFRQAAEQDDKDAMFELAQLLMDDDNNKSAAEAIDWFERSAQMGSSDSQRELGKLYHSGKTGVVFQDFEKAYDLFCRAAQEGDKTATLFIGIYHEHGIHVPPNLDLAREWYEVAVKLGQRQDRHKTGQGGWWLAELALARLLHQQRQEMRNAYGLFKAAYDHAPFDQKKTAMTMVSLYQLYGWGDIPARPTEAAASLLKLATQDGGEPKVFIHVAKCFHSGLGVEKDRTKAFEWFGRVVTHHQDLLDEEGLDEQDELDYAEAVFYLAEYYAHGWDVVVVDHSKAMDLYQLAAEHGSQEAQQRLLSRTLPP